MNTLSQLEFPYKGNNFLNVGLLPSQEGNYFMQLEKLEYMLQTYWQKSYLHSYSELNWGIPIYNSFSVNEVFKQQLILSMHKINTIICICLLSSFTHTGNHTKIKLCHNTLKILNCLPHVLKNRGQGNKIFHSKNKYCKHLSMLCIQQMSNLFLEAIN